MTKEHYLKHCELQALWWIAFANTQANFNRKIYHCDGTLLTNDEKIEDALNTAKSHIRSFWEAVE